MSDIKQVIKDSFIQYSGAVLQSRALVDVRDCLKPSARQIFYSMLLHKLTHKNPSKKTANAVGMAMADFYIHGDSSCEGVIMRAGQPFAMRYPLVDVKGNMGSLLESGNWAAMRYTESRLGKLAATLFQDIDKNTIKEWRENYDNTKTYPAVLPSKGFYNIVNGSYGIGIGMASSIPTFNIGDVNAALEHLLLNPDCGFEDIYCQPDFPTGALLLNEEEVKQSLKNGRGAACKLRSVVEFDQKERVLTVTEIPYGVYTSTICEQLEKLLDSEKNPGIDRFNDLTGAQPLIKIYLKRSANPDKVLKYLYKETALQSHYGINLTMLDQGRFPRVFTWKEALQAHINHELEVYRRGYEFDLAKIERRIHIINGLIICLANIDEVIVIIKGAESTAAASKLLQSKFLLDGEQASAVLDMRLSRLTRLEVNKLKDELDTLEKGAAAIKAILENQDLLNAELIKGWQKIAKTYGDPHRTKILNISKDDDEPTEVRQLVLNFTNYGNIFVNETSSLYTQRKGGIGAKFKLEKGEYVVSNRVGDNIDTVLFFSNRGNFYHCKMSDLPVGDKINLSSLIVTQPDEDIRAATILSKNCPETYIIFVTKQGMIKKSKLTEYNIKRGNGAKAIDLNTGDKIINVLFLNEEPLGILTAEGNFVLIETGDIRAIGRAAKGVKGIKLNDGDYVVSAKVHSPHATEIVSISEQGLAKRSDMNEFSITGKNTKGKKLQKILPKDYMVDFMFLSGEPQILIISSGAQLKVDTSEISLLGRGAQGSRAIKLSSNQKVVTLSKF